VIEADPQHLTIPHDYNLLVVEVKKRGCGHGQDERKLAAFTTPLPEDGLGYRWGLHLILESKEQGKASLCWYKQGKQCDEQMVEGATRDPAAR
jgi:hypothetical protein